MFYLTISLSVLFYIFSDVFFAQLIRSYGTINTYIYRVISTNIYSLFLIFFIDFGLLNGEILLSSFLLGISGVLYFFPMLESKKYLPIGIVSSIVAFESIIVIALSYFVYNEQLSYGGYFGAILLIASGILLSMYKYQSVHLNPHWYKGVLYAFVGMVFGSLWGFGFAMISRKTDIYTGIYLSEISIGAALFLGILFSKNLRSKIHYNSKMMGKIFFISIFPILASGAYFLSTVLGQISISILFLSFVPIGTSIFAYFFLNEKLHLYHWICILVGTGGLVMINV